MRVVVCNFCGMDDAELVNRGPDLLLNRVGDYRLVRCRRCGLIYQNPQPTLAELAAYYPVEYVPYKSDISRFAPVQRLSEQHNLQRRCALLERHVAGPGRLLDVGCATGLFLNAMRQRGWQGQGVELNAYAATYAREQYGLAVYIGTLESAEFPPQSFDVVTMWDVLEHVLDPLATLCEIARLLRPGGWLALSLPNPDCPEACWFGSAWVGWDRPRHLHLFTRPVLENYCRAAGLQVETVESLGGRLGLTLMSLEFACKARGWPEARWRTLTAWLYNWPLRLFTWPLYHLAERRNLTTEMNVFVRRPLD